MKLYSYAHASVRVNGIFSGKFRIERSVLQGEFLSAKLFNLFLEDVVESICESNATGIHVGPHIIDMILFADDMVILALSPRDLQCKIDALKKYFELNNLQINLSKTNIVIFRRRAALSRVKFTWGDEEIKIVNEYKYLRIHFHRSGKFNKHFENALHKAKTALNSVIQICRKGKIGNFKVFSKLFNSLVSSTLLYGAPVWCVDYLDKIVTFQNNYIRKLFYLPNETPRYKLILETNAKPIECTVLKLLLGFLYRIKKKAEQSLVKSILLLQLKNASCAYTNWIKKINIKFAEWNIPLLDKKCPFWTKNHILQTCNKPVGKHHELVCKIHENTAIKLVQSNQN